MQAGVTGALCRGLVELCEEPLPPAVAKHAQRSLLNVLATAIGASQDTGVAIASAHALEHGGAPVASLLGRPERTDAVSAALVNGFAAHLDDFDDTHLETVIHPGAATMATVLSIGQWRGATGERALRAFALGCEAQLRLGLAISPSHYDAGWHITGTCGVLGATVAGGLLVGLDAEELERALGVAAGQVLGHRESFGTMAKAFHPGKAAANGVLALLLAESGLRGYPGALDTDSGLLAVLGDEADDVRAAAAADLGTRWELARNTFKPYPCGIVCHPAIDGAVALHQALGDQEAGGIEQVTVRCHELVPELTGNPQPADGLEARFSTIHGVAAGLVDGTVGLAQYADERVRAADLTDLRARVALTVDPAIDRDGAVLEVRLRDGRRLAETVEHARGSHARPLSDAELLAKARALIDPVLPGAADDLARAVAGLAERPDLGQLLALATPQEQAVSQGRGA